MKRAKPMRRRGLCPISFGLDIFGDKWSLLILRDIMFYGRARYSDFASSPEHIATNVLADRLATLERAGIIRKRRSAALKNQFIYSVTDKGRDLLPTLIELMLWGVQYDPQTPAGKQFRRRAKADQRGLVRDIKKSIRGGTFRQLAAA